MLGIIMVVKTTVGGDLLVMRYPPIYRKEVTKETLSAFMQNESGENKEEFDWSSQPYAMPSVFIAPLLSPKTSCCGKTFELVVERTRFIGFPISLDSQPTENNSKQEDSPHKKQEDTPKKTSNIQLTTFNIVFAVDNSEVSERRIETLERICKQTSTAYFREEKRCKYLTKQVNLLISLREKWLKAQTENSKISKPSLLLSSLFSKCLLFVYFFLNFKKKKITRASTTNFLLTQEWQRK